MELEQATMKARRENTVRMTAKSSSR